MAFGGAPYCGPAPLRAHQPCHRGASWFKTVGKRSDTQKGPDARSGGIRPFSGVFGFMKVLGGF